MCFCMLNERIFTLLHAGCIDGILSALLLRDPSLKIYTNVLRVRRQTKADTGAGTGLTRRHTF